MSAQDFIDHLARTPDAYVLIANSVWGRAEHEAVVALFDTEDMAWVYVDASRLPGGVWTNHPRPISRRHRPDSILWDFNRHDWMTSNSPRVMKAPLGLDYTGTPVNPAPPSGPLKIIMFDGLAPESVAKVEGWP